MFRYAWIDQFATTGLEGGKRTLLVSAHKAAVAGDVGRQDGRQPAFDSLVGHKNSRSFLAPGYHARARQSGKSQRLPAWSPRSLPQPQCFGSAVRAAAQSPATLNRRNQRLLRGEAPRRPNARAGQFSRIRSISRMRVYFENNVAGEFPPPHNRSRRAATAHNAAARRLSAPCREAPRRQAPGDFQIADG